MSKNVENLIELIKFQLNQQERIDLLKELPIHLTSFEIYDLKKDLEEYVKKFDIIEKLPLEISMRILSHLNISSLKNVLQVSKEWNRIAQADMIWKYKIMDLGYDYRLKASPDNNGEDESLSFTHGLNYENMQLRRATNETARDIRNSYFELCKHYLIRDLRWKFMHNEFTVRFKVHTNKISGLVLKGDFVVSASVDRTLCIWQISKNKPLFLHRGYPDSIPFNIEIIDIPLISCLDYCPKYNIIALGTFNREIILIHLNDEDVKREELVYHTGAITCIKIVYPHVFSGAADFKICMYNIENSELVHEFNEHSDKIVSFDVNEKFIISSSKDQTLCVFDIQKQCLASRERLSYIAKDIHLDENAYIYRTREYVFRAECPNGLDGGPPNLKQWQRKHHRFKSVRNNRRFIICLSGDEQSRDIFILEKDLRIRNDMLCPNRNASFMEIDDDKIVLANDNGTISIVSFIPASSI